MKYISVITVVCIAVLFFSCEKSNQELVISMPQDNPGKVKTSSVCTVDLIAGQISVIGSVEVVFWKNRSNWFFVKFGEILSGLR